jgi:branched-chain amino acid transport system ATP-binding protein
MSLLSGHGLLKRFGGLTAVDGVDFELNQGELLGLIGPNGAGKTTLFNLIGGMILPDAGHVALQGKTLSGLAPFEISRAGVGRTFQIVRPFLKMSCLDNVRVGFLGRRGAAGPLEAGALLTLVGLEGKGEALAEDLTLIEKKRLELARALAGKPKVLLLDEVLSGLNPTEMTAALILISRIRRDFDVAILWIEHVMGAVMKACDRLIVMDQGKKIAVGTPAAVAKDPAVVAAYLGKSHA